MKVIFLDIDGVLNCGTTRSKAPSGCMFVEDRFVRNLAEIVKYTGAKIVLSSSWRYEWNESDDFFALVNKLKEFNIELFDKTPIYADCFSRDEEISAWLSAHQDIESYIVLDDETYLFNDKQNDVKNHLLFIDEFFGLTETLANLAIVELNKYEQL